MEEEDAEAERAAYTSFLAPAVDGGAAEEERDF